MVITVLCLCNAADAGRNEEARVEFTVRLLRCWYVHKIACFRLLMSRSFADDRCVL